MLNVQKNIILTHWGGSEDRKIFVNPSLSKYVQNYHLLQLRFLYSRYKNKFKGVVLNPNQDMVCPISISAFLSTIPKLENPVLVLSSNYNLKYWRYFLSLIPQANLQINGSNKELETKSNNLVIVLGSSKDLLQTYEKFSIIIIDNIDSFINTRTKRAAFNIGITYSNFYKNPDDQLLWNILNWSNIYFVGNCVTFTTKYYELLKNCVEPYPSIFLRTTWEYCNSFKKINLKELQNEINNNLDTSDSSDSDENETINHKKRKTYQKPAQSLKKVKNSAVNNKEKDDKKTPVKKSKEIEISDLSAIKNIFEISPKNQQNSLGKSYKKTATKINDISYEIDNPKSLKVPKTNIEYADLLETSSINSDDLLFISNDIIKQEAPSSQSSDDASNSVLGKIIDSPVKNCPVLLNSLELLEKDLSAFENSNILSQIFDIHETSSKSVLDNILDAKLSKAVEHTNILSDSYESDEESVLSKLFPN